MGGAHEWPAWLRDLVRMECLGRARVSLPVNLLGNVVPPIIVAEHAAPRLVDKRACDDVHDLRRRASTEVVLRAFESCIEAARRKKQPSCAAQGTPFF